MRIIITSKYNALMIVLFNFLAFHSILFSAEEAVVGTEEIKDEIKEQNKKEDTFKYSAEELRDPFKTFLPITKEDEQDKTFQYIKEHITLPPFQIQGVLWGSSLPQAIVDNSVVKIGDTIKGAKVVNITRDYIEFLYMKEHFSVKTPYLQKDDFKDGDILMPEEGIFPGEY